ncbi:MAG: hypothetical protein QNK05_02385 [Myxococcota bacterium]|nr:hypothetical protein [Myxococcota bacterium]
MHLLWSLLAGLGPGALLVLLISREAPLPILIGGALLGGGLLTLCVFALERNGGWEPERGRMLAQGASSALLAWPAIGALLLDLPPHRALAGVLALAALVGSLWLAARRRGPADPLLRHVGIVALGFAGFGVLLGGAAALSPLLLGTPALPPGAFASGSYDVDATVALEPLLECGAAVASSSTLLDRGAHPRLAGEGRFVFFDAEVEGERQIQRLDREDGSVRCLTCGQPGHNRRPAPSPAGTGVVFDTDRHRSWRHPMNTELYALEIREDDRPRAAIRLTRDLRPDDHPLYDPSGRGILWTRVLGPEFAVVRGAIRGGHGGVILTGTTLVTKGGLQWPGALAWAPDARALAVGYGHDARPLDLVLSDPATDATLPAIAEVAAGASVSFSADGQRLAIVTTRPSGAASLLPKRLGFLLGRLAPALTPDGVTGPGETRLFVGPKGDAKSIELDALGSWGAPTGVALAPAGDALVLGQRRHAEGATSERLVWIELDCETAGGPVER